MMSTIVLASRSPRRKALLEMCGYACRIQPADIDESQYEGEPAIAYVERMCLEKMQVIIENGDLSMPVVTADTIVVLEDEILGKPRDCADNLAMLERLNDRAHEVMTAFCVHLPNHTRVCETVVTRVIFGHNAHAMLQRYADSGDGLDKAGGYGIQTAAGTLIERIEGSHSAVIGLPLYEICRALASWFDR